MNHSQEGPPQVYHSIPNKIPPFLLVSNVARTNESFSARIPSNIPLTSTQNSTLFLSIGHHTDKWIILTKGSLKYTAHFQPKLHLFSKYRTSDGQMNHSQKGPPQVYHSLPSKISPLLLESNIQGPMNYSKDRSVQSHYSLRRKTSHFLLSFNITG
jgi:hypothetical protein